MYTIGQVSTMFDLPVSTLRYYDKEGFFPNLERKGNIRYFSDNELEALRIIECLKKSGLEIKDIKQFFLWYYETAMKDGNEDAINAMLPDKLPENIQKLYNEGHE